MGAWRGVPVKREEREQPLCAERHGDLHTMLEKPEPSHQGKAKLLPLADPVSRIRRQLPQGPIATHGRLPQPITAA